MLNVQARALGKGVCALLVFILCMSVSHCVCGCKSPAPGSWPTPYTVLVSSSDWELLRAKADDLPHISP